jgi:hypothetical protein
MVKDPEVNQQVKQENADEVVKQVYDKPQVVYSAPLEAVAGICSTGLLGKAPGPCQVGFS